jgi:alkanesulfonate monooxygenase SsuD/methylene tetrahydromethanopterin reductase-like flavin-dependent oxidoreductase (luciferase family)
MRQHYKRIGRDPAEIESSTNPGSCFGDRRPEMNPEGCISGSIQQVIDKIGECQDLGIEGVNIAFRPPVDWEGLQCCIEDVMPCFR